MISLLTALALLLADPPSQGAPAPPLALANHINAEHARNARLPPTPPRPPPRYAPKLLAAQESLARALADICTECRGQPPKRRPTYALEDPRHLELLLEHVSKYDQNRDRRLAEAAELDRSIRHADLNSPQLSQSLRSRQAKLVADAHVDVEQMVKLLRVLARDPQFAASPLTEESIYLYILELDKLGQTTEARDVELSFKATYPTSPYQIHLDITAAHDSLAHGQLTAARRVFERVLTGPDTSLHANAHLALGWSHMRSESGEAPRPDRALASFTRAIETATPTDPATLQSAQDGLVHALAATNPDHAITLIIRLAGLIDTTLEPAERRAVGLIERLALYTFVRGQHHDSAELYRHLLQRHPDDPQQCKWQLRLLLTAVAARDPDAQRRETLALADISRQWQGEHRHHPSHRQRCQDDARTALSALAPRSI